MSTNPVSAATAVNPYTAAAVASSGASGAASSGMQSLTANDFLTLMTAQLKNQDPLNPADSNQFLSQLAQLSTVTGISSMSNSMSTLSASLLSSQALSSATLVGHNILTAADTGTFATGQPLRGALQVPAGASSVTLTITDASGAVVRHLAVNATGGLQGFGWDGTTDSGGTAPPGLYGVAGSATVSGTTQAVSTLLIGTVTSVSINAAGSGVTLNTPELGSVPLSSVQQIS